MSDLFRCPDCFNVEKRAAAKKGLRAGDARRLWCWRCRRFTTHTKISKTKKGLRT